MRNKKGQFGKGYSRREPKLYWDKQWLQSQYGVFNKPASQIAKEQGCKENNILYFLKKHGIKTRTMSEVRKIKKWVLSGKANGMYGRIGKDNPNWNGGGSHDRQAAYARTEWKKLAKLIRKRDGLKCTKCGINHSKNNKLVVHHIKAWSKYPKLRFKSSNLQTLCEKCHRKFHSRSK